MLLRDLSWRSSLASQNLCVFRFSLRLTELPLQRQFIRCATHRFSFCLELAKNSSRVGTKIRARRGVKSNEELRDELREFVLMVGLPEGHVPSWKELSEHGRKDLANVVRRRGYKLITELLTSSKKEDNITDMSSAENHEADDICKDESVVVEGQDQKGDEAPKCSTCENSDAESYSSESNGGVHLLPVTKSESFEFSAYSSLQEKAAKFVQVGELEVLEGEGDASNIGHGISSLNGRNTEESDLNKVAEMGTSRVELSNFEATSDNATLVMNAREGNSSAEGIEVNDGDHQVEIRRLKDMLHQKELELTQLKEQIEKEKLALSALQAKAEREIGKARVIISAKDEELLAAEESLSGLKEVQIEYWGNAETVEMAGSFNGWHDRVKMDAHPASSTLDLTDSRKSGLWSVVLWLYPGIYEEARYGILTLITYYLCAIFFCMVDVYYVFLHEPLLRLLNQRGIQAINNLGFGLGSVNLTTVSLVCFERLIVSIEVPVPPVIVSCIIPSLCNILAVNVIFSIKRKIKFIVDGHWQIDAQRESVTRGTIHNNILRVDR